MKRPATLIVGGAVFAAGYLLGTCQIAAPTPLQAVQPPAVTAEVSDETLDAYQAVYKSVVGLNDSLTAESRITPVGEKMNYFALSVGGIDAVADLETGRGVDPETFAAIYAGRALPAISHDLEYDHPDGRIRYKGTIVRMYSRERLKKVFQNRDALEIRSLAQE